MNLTYEIMITSTLKKCVTTLLCSFLCLTIANAQATVIEVPLSRQIELSTQIVEGKVIFKESFWDDSHSNIYTKQIIQVYKVFKGQTLETVEVITKGGVLGLEAQVVSHSLKLKNGDLGLFLLKQKTAANFNKTSTSITFETVSEAQGFYKYSLEKNIAVNPLKNIKGINANLYTQIKKVTNLNFVEVLQLKDSNTSQLGKSSNAYSKSSMAPAISSFSSNSLSAGTKTIITINGSGFGIIKGKVGFSDANYGGYLHSDALDNQVISWSDNEIEVEIPDRAGTGTIKVTTSTSESIVSSQDLTIDFAQINIDYNTGSGDMAYQTQHINNNENGGNTWTMNQDFNNSEAKDPFSRAFESWTCNTGVNWEISSSTTSINTNANDGISVITFDNTMGSGTLGQCYSRYSGCYDDASGEIKWYVTEMDIVFNANQNWNYSTNLPANDQVDFETVTIHELGHGHQLGHVVDTNVVMHYSISNGESLRELDAVDLAGAIDVQSRSTTTTICDQESMTESSCFLLTLSTDVFELENDIAVFPNPAKETVYIKNEGSINIDKISIYSILGKQVYTSKGDNSNRLKTINISSFSKGLYLIQIVSEFGAISKKLIVN